MWRAHQRHAQTMKDRPRREMLHHRFDVDAEADITRDELTAVSKGVRQLSAGLTRERELVGAKYMDDHRLLGAYLLFYWPVSYAQARAVLSEIPPFRTVLDLGSGPGPMAFAALDAGGREVICADRSVRALDIARALASEAGESLGTREWSPQQPIPSGTYDLIIMGHVINELFSGDIRRRSDFIEQVMKSLSPKGTLMIIEPALRETSRALLSVRDVLVSRGYAVRAPCLYRGACPALIKESDWCHAERDWEMPSLVETVARQVGLHKESLKMSYLAVAPKAQAWAEPPEGNVFRIVSEALPGKGRLRFMGCGPSGRIGLSLQEKHVSDRNKLFEHLHRGDVIRVTSEEERGDGVALGEESTVEIIARAGQSVPQETK